MCVAAHPDDEDGATLALHRMHYGVETHAVIATRGEGGQNEIGPELYEALAVIRTAEMREAARIEGAQLHFLDLPEFGFSKSPEEAFAVWGKEETLRRLVRMIRTVRPHVIITHHGRDKDHGHHQAVGQALLEAFDLAGDATVFPEQLAEGLTPWQPLRLYIRNWTGGADSVNLDISALDPVRGVTYAEVAADALRAHHSQGMEFFIERLLNDYPISHYDLVKEAPIAPGAPKLDEAAGPLFAGLPLEADATRRSLATASDPARCVQGAVAMLKARGEGEEALARWRDANRAAAVACAFRLEASPVDALVTPEQPVAVRLRFSDFEASEAQRLRVALCAHGADPADDGWTELPLEGKRSVDSTLTVALPEGTGVTLPKPEHVFSPDYDVPQFDAVALVDTAEGSVELRAPVRVDIAPLTQLAYAEPRHLLRTQTPGPVSMRLSLTNEFAEARMETVTVDVPAGWTAAPAEAVVQFAGEGEQRWLTITVTPGDNLKTGVYPVTVTAASHHEPAIAEVQVADVATRPGARVGVIQSYDDTLINTLAQLDIEHAAIGPADFTPAVLDTFTAIVVDMRAYAKRPDLVASNAALLAYAERGGTLLVMYQKTFEWSPDYAPYPLHVSRNRVTVEDAPVTLLVPDDPLFHTPNAIGDADWAGWIQERGLYFADTFDDHYVPLLACNDPGETIPPGGLLRATVGKGTYVYTGLALYRQLRALHPGALRLFANLVAL